MVSLVWILCLWNYFSSVVLSVLLMMYIVQTLVTEPHAVPVNFCALRGISLLSGQCSNSIVNHNESLWIGANHTTSATICDQLLAAMSS